MRLRKNTTSSTTAKVNGQPAVPKVTPAVRAAVAAAMAFRRRGSPEAELAFDEDCPKTTAEDWKDAERANIKFTGRR